MVQLTYQTSSGATLFIRQWVPVNAALEVLASSRPIQTKWGKGFMLTLVGDLTALWVDVGATRVSVFTRDVEVLTREQILGIAETLGPPSNNQNFYFQIATPQIKDMAPAPPFEVPVNAQGVQEVTLVITPGGYSPIRFAVKKDLPVRLIFKQLGQVGCGNELLFTTGPGQAESLRLDKESDSKVLEFTPHTAGEFEFDCSHRMYRGIFIVR